MDGPITPVRVSRRPSTTVPAARLRLGVHGRHSHHRGDARPPGRHGASIAVAECLRRAPDRIHARECLDHVIVLRVAGLRRVLAEYVAYYTNATTHLSLARTRRRQDPSRRRLSGASSRVQRSTGCITATTARRHRRRFEGLCPFLPPTSADSLDVLGFAFSPVERRRVEVMRSIAVQRQSELCRDNASQTATGRIEFSTGTGGNWRPKLANVLKKSGGGGGSRAGRGEANGRSRPAWLRRR